MGFWKEVSYEISLGKSREIAIKDAIKYYQKYKPSYFKDNEKSKHRIITFYRLGQPNWHMKCRRTYLQALKMGWRHIFKGHAFAFSVKNI